MIAVIYDAGPDQVYLPEHGITVQRGVPVEVPDEVAGREPGPWRRARPEEMAPGGGWTPAGWPLHDEQAFDGEGFPVWSTRDPGAGLLAQEGFWRRAGSAPADETPQEG